MDAALRALVLRRSADRCEYCRLAASATEMALHIEHIVALQHGGDDDPSNLASACDRSNLHKGTNLASVDPETGAAVLLFHPRLDRWSDHFRFDGSRIVGQTPPGRATVRLLQMNSLRRLQLRARLLATGQFPQMFD